MGNVEPIRHAHATATPSQAHVMVQACSRAATTSPCAAAAAITMTDIRPRGAAARRSSVIQDLASGWRTATADAVDGQPRHVEKVEDVEVFEFIGGGRARGGGRRSGMRRHGSRKASGRLGMMVVRIVRMRRVSSEVITAMWRRAIGTSTQGRLRGRRMLLQARLPRYQKVEIKRAAAHVGQNLDARRRGALVGTGGCAAAGRRGPACRGRRALAGAVLVQHALQQRGVAFGHAPVVAHFAERVDERRDGRVDVMLDGGAVDEKHARRDPQRKGKVRSERGEQRVRSDVVIECRN
ncbi:hypothetical protein HDK77DRAFT_291657 [Phyllosticta capitalensis]